MTGILPGGLLPGATGATGATSAFTTVPDVRFPPGTVLNVYSEIAGKVADQGRVHDTATVAADSTTRFTGLPAGRYMAGTSTAGPFVFFSVYA